MTRPTWEFRILFVFSIVLGSWFPLSGCGRSEPPVPPPEDRLRKTDPSVTCERCGFTAGKEHICARTRWCGTCSRDVGDDHICGRTEWCPDCRRESGKYHVCGETTICWNRLCSGSGNIIERGPNHVHGKTTYCRRCRVDRIAEDHDCNLGTYTCPRCEVEVSDTHVCGLSCFCPVCKREASLPRPCSRHFPDVAPKCRRCKTPHSCGNTSFCGECRKEHPLTHSH